MGKVKALLLELIETQPDSPVLAPYWAEPDNPLTGENDENDLRNQRLYRPGLYPGQPAAKQTGIHFPDHGDQ
jgi:hypothetical protein